MKFGRALPPDALPWFVVLVAASCFAVVLTALNLAAGALIGGIVGAALVVLWRKEAMHLYSPLYRAAQVVLGVTIGFVIRPDALWVLTSHWVGVLTVLLGTITVSVLAALALVRSTPIDNPTAQLGMVAGGASGIVSMSDDVGADARLVAAMQYVRVYLVIALLPWAAAVLPGQSVYGSLVARPAGDHALLVGFGLLVASGAVTSGILRVVRVPSGALLLPMFFAAAFSLSVPQAISATLPGPLQDMALAVIGIQIGLQLTRESLRVIRRLLPALLLVMVILIIACAGLGVALSAITHRSPLDGYLATTPGGLYAVLGVVATSSNVDGAFITAIQTLRVFIMMLLASCVGYWFGRSAQT